MSEDRQSRLQSSSKLLEVLAGKRRWPPPVWFMRQAGRYLPEYRALRGRAGSFLDLCFNPELATEVTLQPVRRFDLDAAILFSDILVVPKALGQELTFVEGEGPRLFPPVSAADVRKFEARSVLEDLAPIFETVRRVRAELAPEKALIGFAGAPWTVATYMLAGGPSEDASALRSRFYRDPLFIDALIELLIEATGAYLCAQVEAGVDALQLFDTWAGGLPENLARRLSLEPMRRIAEHVKGKHPDTPIIFFPRGVGAFAPEYARLSACDALSIDTATPWVFARESISPHAVIQGGFDPLLVVAGGRRMEEETLRLFKVFEGVPYIFNLGHGFTPDTPPEHVARLVETIRKGP